MGRILDRKADLHITKTDNFIFLLFACWCIVDALNGYMIRNGYVSISQIYKLFVAVVVVIRCRNNARVLNYLGVVFLYLLLYIVNLVMHGEEVIKSLVWVSKLLTSLLFYYYFIEVKYESKEYMMNKFTLVIKWNFLIYAANMVLGSFGVGYTAYGGEEGFGARGFFYASNELSGVVAVLFPWILYYVKRNYSIVTYFLCGVVLLYLTYEMSTKAGLFATIIAFLMICFLYGNKGERILILALSVVAAYYIYNSIQFILDSNIPVIGRFNYFLERNGLESAVTSGRLDKWEDLGPAYINSDSITKIFGVGGARTVEMDVYDALLNCGIIGLVLLLWLYVKMLFSPLKKKYKAIPFRKVVALSNSILVLISLIGGHLLFSSMAGMLIVLSNAMLFGDTRRNSVEISNSCDSVGDNVTIKQLYLKS